MSFTIEGGTKEVWQCEDCGWCQTRKHFAESDGSISCLLCGSSAEVIETIQETVGMSDFKYRELLSTLEEEADGVGAATVTNIEQHFDDGDDFLDAAKDAYQDLDTDILKEVSGVGQSSAKQIALTMAESEGWENGAIFEF